MLPIHSIDISSTVQKTPNSINVAFECGCEDVIGIQIKKDAMTPEKPTKDWKKPALRERLSHLFLGESDDEGINAGLVEEMDPKALTKH